MKSAKKSLCATVALAVMAAPVLAGGFWLQLGNPEANAEARDMKAVLTFMPTGCGNKAGATVSAVAVGMAGGSLQTVPLHVKALSKPALYAITREWPREGRWVIQITARFGGSETSAIVPVDDQGAHRTAAKFLARRANNDDLAEALAGGN